MQNLNRHIWKGWRVSNFIDDLDPLFHIVAKHNPKKINTEQKIKLWCKDNQPYYKKSIKEVNTYFINLSNTMTLEQDRFF